MATNRFCYSTLVAKWAWKTHVTVNIIHYLAVYPLIAVLALCSRLAEGTGLSTLLSLLSFWRCLVLLTQIIHVSSPPWGRGVSIVSVYYLFCAHWASTHIAVFYFRSDKMWMGISSKRNGWAESCVISKLQSERPIFRTPSSPLTGFILQHNLSAGKLALFFCFFVCSFHSASISGAQCCGASSLTSCQSNSVGGDCEVFSLPFSADEVDDFL